MKMHSVYQHCQECHHHLKTNLPALCYFQSLRASQAHFSSPASLLHSFLSAKLVPRFKETVCFKDSLRVGDVYLSSVGACAGSLLPNPERAEQQPAAWPTLSSCSFSSCYLLMLSFTLRKMLTTLGQIVQPEGEGRRGKLSI